MFSAAQYLWYFMLLQVRRMIMRLHRLHVRGGLPCLHSAHNLNLPSLFPRPHIMQIPFSRRRTRRRCCDSRELFLVRSFLHSWHVLIGRRFGTSGFPHEQRQIGFRISNSDFKFGFRTSDFKISVKCSLRAFVGGGPPTTQGAPDAVLGATENPTEFFRVCPGLLSSPSFSAILACSPGGATVFSAWSLARRASSLDRASRVARMVVTLASASALNFLFGKPKRA